MINKTNEAVREAISRKSAYALPNRPSESGIKPDEIRRAFWSPVTDAEDSVLSEINRVVDEANEEFDAREEKIIGAVPYLKQLNSEAKDNINELNRYDGLVPEIEKLVEGARKQAELADEAADRAENALADKLDKDTTSDDDSAFRLYGVTKTGEQRMFHATYLPTPYGIAIYTEDGCLRTNAPEEDTDCANKAYVLKEAQKAYERGYDEGYSGWFELSEQVDELEERVDELEGNLAEKEAENAALEERVAELESENAALDAELTRALEDFEQDLGSAYDEISDLQTEIWKLEQTIDELEKTIAELGG